MANFINLLNEQIRRLARREINTQTRTLRRLNAQHRRDIAALKRVAAKLLKAVAFLETQEKRRVAEEPVAPQEVEGVRFRADGLRSHRARLGFSAKDYGTLVGVTGQTIYDWEAGASRPRPQQVARVAAVRGMGKREAIKRLELLGAPVSSRRRLGRPTAKDFIVSLVKAKRGMAGSEIRAAWSQDGRPGKPDNTLGLLVKEGKLKRTKVQGARGSTYA